MSTCLSAHDWRRHQKRSFLTMEIWSWVSYSGELVLRSVTVCWAHCCPPRCIFGGFLLGRILFLVPSKFSFLLNICCLLLDVAKERCSLRQTSHLTFLPSTTFEILLQEGQSHQEDPLALVVTNVTDKMLKISLYAVFNEPWSAYWRPANSRCVHGFLSMLHFCYP